MANTLLDLFEKNPQLLEWRDKVTLLSRQLVMGFSGSSKAVVMASALSEQVPKILIVTSTQNEAEQLTGDLSAILGEDIHAWRAGCREQKPCCQVLRTKASVPCCHLECKKGKTVRLIC